MITAIRNTKTPTGNKSERRRVVFLLLSSPILKASSEPILSLSREERARKVTESELAKRVIRDGSVGRRGWGKGQGGAEANFLKLF